MYDSNLVSKSTICARVSTVTPISSMQLFGAFVCWCLSCIWLRLDPQFWSATWLFSVGRLPWVPVPPHQMNPRANQVSNGLISGHTGYDRSSCCCTCGHYGTPSETICRNIGGWNNSERHVLDCRACSSYVGLCRNIRFIHDFFMWAMKTCWVSG